MKNYKLTLMYDGTQYCGWQKQPNAVSIESELMRVIDRVCSQKVEVIGVSRTDSGVHAMNYVCNVHLETDKPIWSLVKGFNSQLGEDIKITKMEICDDNFHARYNAKSKTYIYKIDNTPYGNVFQRNFAWHYKYKLSYDKMKQAAKQFEGKHDFSAFMSTGSGAKNFEREIFDCTMTENEGMIEIVITGNRFLYNMVRIIAGTLVAVGRKTIAPEDIPNIIASKDRSKAGINAPAKGLTLYKINY